TAHRIGAALRVVARQHLRRTDIEALPPGVGYELGDGGAVAQAEIEALRTDRRHDVGGFADERDAGAGKGVRGLDRERKNAAASLDAHLAEQRMGAALD